MTKTSSECGTKSLPKLRRKLASSILLAIILVCLFPRESLRAKPDRPPWAEICATVQSIVLPKIPASSKAAAIGDVVVRLKINSKGMVEKADLVSGNQELGSYTIAAVNDWKFGKGPLASTIPEAIELTFRFKTGRDNLTIINENDGLVVVMPSEILDPKVLIASGLTMNSMAAERKQPPFPSRAPRMSGRIVVAVEADETGKVLSATPSVGPLPYQEAAKEASLQWKFREILVNGIKVRLYGYLTFNWTVSYS